MIPSPMRCPKPMPATPDSVFNFFSGARPRATLAPLPLFTEEKARVMRATDVMARPGALLMTQRQAGLFTLLFGLPACPTIFSVRALQFPPFSLSLLQFICHR